MSLQAEKALGDIGFDIGVYVQVELLVANLVDQGVNLILQGVGKEETRFDSSRAVTGGAGLLDVDAHGGTYALASDLHQAEFRKRQDVVLGAVLLHVLTHALVEHLTVLGQFHVDEIHDDDTTHVSQSQLARQLVGSTEVGLEGIGLLSVFLLDACAAVHIDHMHGLRCLDDEVSAVLIVDRFPEA